MNVPKPLKKVASVASVGLLALVASADAVPTVVDAPASLTALGFLPQSYLINAGWPSAELADDNETALAKQAVIIFAKMAVNTDPTEMQMNPVLVSMIAQARLTAPVAEDDGDGE